MKKIVIMSIMMAIGLSAMAQDDKIETTVSADIVSSYVWRGLDLGSTAIQPTLGIGYMGLSLSAWGSYGLTDPNDTKELDLTLSYSTGGFSVGLTDYWFNAGPDPKNRYFKYDSHGTNHLFETFAGYDFGILSATWYTNIAGNDGANEDGKRAYSSYFEVCAPFKLCSTDWSATVGVVPFATTSYETTGFAVTNLSLRADKEIRITDTFSIPVFGQFTGNPCSRKAYLVFGVTLQP